jgi:hypothetical protein
VTRIAIRRTLRILLLTAGALLAVYLVSYLELQA